MSVDRLLTTTLRAYQAPPAPADTDLLLARTVTLLANLNNPLNLSLLTSHLLTAHALWDLPDVLPLCLRVVGIYSTAAVHVQRYERENAELPWGQKPAGGGLACEPWARAVAKGADDRSPRWKHLLVLTGLLMGLEGRETGTFFPSGLRATLEQAVVTAANLALQHPAPGQDLPGHAVVLALSYAFPMLSEHAKRSLNANLLLPAAIHAMMGPEGFQNAQFLRALSAGNVAGQETFYRPIPGSFDQIEQLESRPLAKNMGPLSRLAAFAVQHAADPNLVLQAQDQLLFFSDELLERWRQCFFASIDESTEAAVLAPEMLQGHWAMLWQLLRKIMYTVVATLQPIVARCLLDPHLRNAATAPRIATKTLLALRSLCFISSRQGADAFQVYTFTYLTSIDILTRSPDACVSFLQRIQPPPLQEQSPTALTPLDQVLMLFYLNTAEHLPLSLPTPAAEGLVLAVATAHLASPVPGPPTAFSVPLYEAAHATVLSALSCPQHAPLAITTIPFYVDELLGAFPARIHPRQFRLAFKTVIQVASPPFPVAAAHPDLAETLLEMLHLRSLAASTHPLPPDPAPAGAAPIPEDQAPPSSPPLSEQTTLVLALIEALPFLPLAIVEEWLTRTAEAMNEIVDPAMREAARKRFWDVLVSGEMDVERASVGVAWWGTGGGREMVLLHAPRGKQFMMSGALGAGPPASRL